MYFDLNFIGKISFIQMFDVILKSTEFSIFCYFTYSF